MSSSLAVSGLGSGLDVNGIVSQLMELERRPLAALDTKEASVQAKISAFGSLRGSLSTLQNAIAGLKLPNDANALDFYSTYKGTVSDESVASITASDGTVPGKYSLEVDKLAQEHRIISAGGTSIGTGTLQISLGTADGTLNKTTTIDIASGNLNSVRDAINGANAGVTAAVVNGENGPQLVLTGNETGERQFIHLSGVSGLEYSPAGSSTDFTEQQAAQNAELKLNGIAISSESNKVTSALEGVTLELKKTTPTDEPVRMELTRDTSSINRALERMVTSFNEFHQLSRELGGYNAETNKGGTLLGDSALRGVDGKLRSMLSSVPDSLSSGAAMRTLSDIGISLQKDGTLKLDTDRLNKALETDFAAVADVAAAYGKSMDATITGMIGSNGLITGRTDGLKRSEESIGKQRETLERRLVDIEARYKAQFVALDSLVSGMMQTSDYLQQQLDSLSGMFKKK
ncbi:MAG: flagellar filament capping protein FliD [Rhodocyclaceae bacterium]|jgi:flagellar hook-associated protein 2|nr:flagellar filament capping protein FliD [Rhodocyclaceae bacterium]